MAQQRKLEAWRVLEDAEIALERFRGSKDDVDRRIYWISLVTLIRAVGHVLKKVDGGKNVNFGAVVTARWDVASKEPEFINVIKLHRDSLLKEYRFHVAPSGIQDEAGEDLLTEDGQQILTQNWFGPDKDKMEKPAEEIAIQGLEWWKKELEDLERVAGP